MCDGLQGVDVSLRLVPHPRNSIIWAGLLTNLAGLAGVNSFHKLVISLQAALRELTDKVTAITFKKFPRVSQEGVDGWADPNPPGKLIAEIINVTGRDGGKKIEDKMIRFILYLLGAVGGRLG